VTRDCFALERNDFKIKIAWFPDLGIVSSPLIQTNSSQKEISTKATTHFIIQQ